VLGLPIAAAIGKKLVAGDVKKPQGNYPEIGCKTQADPKCKIGGIGRRRPLAAN
jgi:hypothetical protein